MNAIDTLFAEFDRPDTPGMSFMRVENGQAVDIRCFGLANLQTGARCQPQTNFRLASVTKQFTAMAILMLVERGALALDDCQPKFFADFPDYGSKITIRQLLTHKSGLPDYEDLIPAGTTVPLRDKDVLDILRRQIKTCFTPGTRFRYSNSGYVILGLVVEAVAGGSFADFLRTNIFLPLGMTETVAFEDGISDIPHRARGYSKKGTNFFDTDLDLTSSTLGDGGVYSSINDLLKWDQALYTEKLVSQAMLRVAFTAHSEVSDFGGSGYGYGWYVEGLGSDQRIWHYGSTCGFSTSVHRFPKKKSSIICLANRRDAGLEEIVRQLAP